MNCEVRKTYCKTNHTPLLLWLTAVTVVLAFVVWHGNAAMAQMQVGKRFTYQDAVVLCQMLPVRCQATTEQLAVMYGDKHTPFREYLESRN
jgi:hypothetical protein